ncbi:hypothetical protein TTHERM_00192130 (macronuclear) [Tetrahymena thermophila SB210]|uniref:Uncharacterized protein n=1 Tax=Tetrahymena thermophila (strain SB210) TaxID=312017 RepID=I7MEK8_TETTS|nr:hypothetical protein TTHERM_00192130 [Tetrahymena thermophila SB210]EAR96544.2 hypothetical protein TTHERM_00192130 [Tetrahymena thermophila SB210]|eukprot:XP_001016789.2 hypothetical protein TTHERM_00192130 [Tetrahymena thermophila SB210]
MEDLLDGRKEKTQNITSQEQKNEYFMKLNHFIGREEFENLNRHQKIQTLLQYNMFKKEYLLSVIDQKDDMKITSYAEVYFLGLNIIQQNINKFESINRVNILQKMILQDIVNFQVQLGNIVSKVNFKNLEQNGIIEQIQQMIPLIESEHDVKDCDVSYLIQKFQREVGLFFDFSKQNEQTYIYPVIVPYLRFGDYQFNQQHQNTSQTIYKIFQFLSFNVSGSTDKKIYRQGGIISDDKILLQNKLENSHLMMPYTIKVCPGGLIYNSFWKNVLQDPYGNIQSLQLQMAYYFCRIIDHEKRIKEGNLYNSEQQRLFQNYLFQEQAKFYIYQCKYINQEFLISISFIIERFFLDRIQIQNDVKLVKQNYFKFKRSSLFECIDKVQRVNNQVKINIFTFQERQNNLLQIKTKQIQMENKCSKSQIGRFDLILQGNIEPHEKFQEDEQLIFSKEDRFQYYKFYDRNLGRKENIGKEKVEIRKASKKKRYNLKKMSKNNQIQIQFSAEEEIQEQNIFDQQGLKLIDELLNLNSENQQLGNEIQIDLDENNLDENKSDKININGSSGQKQKKTELNKKRKNQASKNEKNSEKLKKKQKKEQENQNEEEEQNQNQIQYQGQDQQENMIQNDTMGSYVFSQDRIQTQNNINYNSFISSTTFNQQNLYGQTQQYAPPPQQYNIYNQVQFQPAPYQNIIYYQYPIAIQQIQPQYITYNQAPGQQAYYYVPHYIYQNVYQQNFQAQNLQLSGINNNIFNQNRQ